MPDPLTPRRPAFWSAYAVQMRPYLLFISGITGWAGLAFADSIGPLRLAAALFASFLAYGFGQALTDCFQTDTDALSSPYRPLVQGRVRKNDVLVVSIAGLAGCTAIFAALNPRTLVVGALAVALLLAYTDCKRRWWAGPPCNAAVVGLLFIMGALAADVPLASAPFGLWATLAAVVFGYAHFVLTGYFKDIEADRATGYRTIPVRFGRHAAAVVADVLATGCAVSAWWSVRGAGVLSLAFLAAGSIAFVIAQLRLHAVHTDEAAHRAILPGLHAYLLVMSGTIVSRHPAWFIGLVLFHGLFALVVARRPERSQL